jgi:hypothetical protein
VRSQWEVAKIPVTLRVTALSLSGFAILAVAQLLLGHASNAEAFGIGLVVAVATYVWIAIAIAISVGNFARVWENDPNEPFRAAVGLALPFAPVSLFWGVLEINSSGQHLPILWNLGVVAIWSAAALAIGSGIKCLVRTTQPPNWTLFALWIILCIFSGMQTAIHPN